MANFKEFTFNGKNIDEHVLINQILGTLSEMADIYKGQEFKVAATVKDRHGNDVTMPLNHVFKHGEKDVTMFFENSKTGESIEISARVFDYERMLYSLRLSGNFTEEMEEDFFKKYLGIPVVTDAEVCFPLGDDGHFNKCPEKALAASSFVGKGSFEEPRDLDELM